MPPGWSERCAELPQQPERIINESALGDFALLDPEEIGTIPSRLLTASWDSLELTGLRPLHRIPDGDLVSLGYHVRDRHVQIRERRNEPAHALFDRWTTDALAIDDNFGSKEFVDHVQSLPGMKTRKVAELWTSATSRELDPAAQSRQAEPAETLTENARDMASPNSTSIGELYAHYMETHTYSEWERLVEKCLAAKSAEEEL